MGATVAAVGGGLALKACPHYGPEGCAREYRDPGAGPPQAYHGVQRQEPGQTLNFISMIPFRIFASVLGPVAFGLAYAPLHRGWIVQAFGCSCQRGFNANVFSFLLHAGVAARMAGSLCQATARLPLRSRMNAVSLGIIAIGTASFYFWQETRVM